jgi:dihydroorotate dehydrogenase
VALLVKIAPDLEDAEVDAVTDLCIAEGVAGVIAANTTLRRDGLRTPVVQLQALGEGGLSGPPLLARSRELVSRVYLRARGNLVVVGVGGVSTCDDLWSLLRAGASLVQVYTGFVYGGPAFAARLGAALAARLRREGLDSPNALVGLDHQP